MASTVNEDFMQAIRAGDLRALKDCVRRHPEDLHVAFNWGDGHGYAINMAAGCNRPEIIEYLAVECRQSVNRQAGVSSLFTPLHHAKRFNAYAAAAMLLSLGADPSLKNESQESTVEFCRAAQVQSLIDPRYREKLDKRREEEIRAKAEGTWSLTTPREVTHDRELTQSRCRLTDIFNFDTRCWRSVARDMDGGGTGYTLVFFDDVPDPESLRPALLKLKELGGTANEDEITDGRLLKKAPKLPSSSL